ncbi:MAG TPA: HAD family hydrolase, partial [Terrimicrobiaceae bacterium]
AYILCLQARSWNVIMANTGGWKHSTTRSALASFASKAKLSIRVVCWCCETLAMVSIYPPTRSLGGTRDSGSMKWQALATDYDGTIATDGVVDEPTRLALVRLKSANVRTFLVTGRELRDFGEMQGFLPIFDMVIAENGAVLYDPATGETRALAPPPPAAFLAELTRRGVNPLGVGISIVATREPHETTVIEVIKDLGLELQVTFNKGAVMILPAGVNKASGLQAALESFGVSPTSVIGVGDAENDHAFLELCGLPVAVANALPALKEKAALVTTHSAGAGVTELIESALRGDLDSHIAVERSQ